MIKQNLKEQKTLQKTKEEKVHTKSKNDIKPFCKNFKAQSWLYPIPKTNDSNLVFLYW